MATYTLTGVTKGSGTCDHCGRNLKSIFEIRNGATGETMFVGRACCKKLTGWTPQMSQALSMLRQSQMFVTQGFTAEAVANFVCHGLEPHAEHLEHGEKRLAEARRVVAAMA